jgi:chemotaxis protein methyltransferase CheR
MLLETSAVLEGARILGTDLSAASIDAARRGSYPARSFRDGVHPWRDGCFTASGNRWQIDDRFRRRVTFATHNLAAADSPAACGAEPFDLIVCRNVLIYLDEATIVRAAATLLEGLAPGGWLLTGPTDPILPLGPGLLAVTTPAGIAYRRDARRSPAIAPPPVRPRPAPRRRVTASVATLPRPRDFAAADAYVADALRLLDAGNLGEALVAARRARYIDRSSVVAHVVLGRAFRLCGRPDAARRSLRRSRTLLAAHAPEAPVRGAGGVRAGALAAVVAAELSQLARTAALRP